MKRLPAFYLRFAIIASITLIQLSTESPLDHMPLEGAINNIESTFQAFNQSILITKLLSDEKTNVDVQPPQLINQNVVLSSLSSASTISNASLSNDQRGIISPKTFTHKYVNKSDKKSLQLQKKSLEDQKNNGESVDGWVCPNITQNRNLDVECGCDMPLTLRCSGDVHGLGLIAEALRTSKSSVTLLDCTLKNVTVLSEARIFENVSLHGLFISSGEIKRVHRSAFLGMKSPLQTLGLPNNALTNVPSNSLQQLTSLDRLDLSNNKIKLLASTDFLSLQRLTYLELSENQISSISPKTFNPLKNLVTLKLNGNRLGDSVGTLRAIGECYNLRELDLKSNTIKGPLNTGSLPAIRGLEILNLEKNLFTSVQREAFQNFPSLITLSLKHNQIDVLQDNAFIGLNSLQRLDLSYNGIVAVSGASLKHLSRLVILDFTHNFLRALTSDIVSPLPMLKELKLDGNDISIIERNSLEAAEELKTLSLLDNPLACDCKLQSFAEWLANSTKLSSKDLVGAICATPPHLEGAQLSQVAVEALTCETIDTNSHIENDIIMRKISSTFEKQINEKFTISNNSTNIKFIDYNVTSANNLVLNWTLDLNKTIDFHSAFVFEEQPSITIWLNKTQMNTRSVHKDNAEHFIVTIPNNNSLNLASIYEFCLIFVENDNRFLVGCSNNLMPESKFPTTEKNLKIVQKSIKINSDISRFDLMTDRNDEDLNSGTDDDYHYPLSSVVHAKSTKKPVARIEDDSIEIYPSKRYYNTIWPNVSLSILILFLLCSIFLILYKKYRHYYKIQRNSNQTSISNSCSDESINTQEEEDINENCTKYVKLQATTAL